MMDIGLTDPWITLTIKAPNQQINDHTIKCKLDWSVAKLKGYIHETYPNKPVSVLYFILLLIKMWSKGNYFSLFN